MVSIFAYERMLCINVKYFERVFNDMEKYLQFVFKR